MKRQNIPEPQLISLVSGTQPAAPKPPKPTELRQQRVDEFLAARSLAPKSLKPTFRRFVISWNAFLSAVCGVLPENLRLALSSKGKID
jgi:hypothetical protein